MTTAMVFHKDLRKREAGEFVLTYWVRSRADALGVLIEPPSLDTVLPVVQEFLPAKARSIFLMECLRLQIDAQI